MEAGEKSRLVSNIVGHISAARRETQFRQICHFFPADTGYGMRVARGLGINLELEMARMFNRPATSEAV